MKIKAFISYSHIDEKTAKQIAHIFDKLHIEYFFDRKDIGWGSHIPKEVGMGLAACSDVVVIISPASLKSEWVIFEVAQATAIGKRVLPLLTHPSLQPPVILQGLKYVTQIDDVRQYFRILSETSDSRFRAAFEEISVDKNINIQINEGKREQINAVIEQNESPYNRDRKPLINDINQESSIEMTANLSQPNSLVTRFRKHSGLAGMVGVGVGLMCARVLTFWYLWPSPHYDNVYLVGSGTVSEYLSSANPKFANDPQIDLPDGKTKIHVLEGGTETGVKLFADVFDQVDVLAMASNQKELKDGFAPYSEHKPAVFEVYLGYDPLQVFLVAKDSISLFSTFSNLLSMDGASGVKLDSVVARVWRHARRTSANDTTRWSTKGYKVFATMPGSATREKWESRFRSVDPEGEWPHNLQPWDTQFTKEAESDVPSIFLGSKALNHRSISGLTITKVRYKELEVLGNSGQEARSLFVYGRVQTQMLYPIASNPKIQGYKISKPISNTLSFLFDILDNNPNAALSHDEIELQRDYFHLGEKAQGWVPEHPNGHKDIYRAGLPSPQSQATKK